MLNSRSIPNDWSRNAPCGCGTCPECLEWTELAGDATYPLTVEHNGWCFRRIRGNVAVVLPEIETLLPGGFCVTIHSDAAEGNLYVRPHEGDAPHVIVPHMLYEDVLYDYITIQGTDEVCVCWDGENYLVIGDATGWDGT